LGVRVAPGVFLVGTRYGATLIVLVIVFPAEVREEADRQQRLTVARRTREAALRYLAAERRRYQVDADERRRRIDLHHEMVTRTWERQQYQHSRANSGGGGHVTQLARSTLERVVAANSTGLRRLALASSPPQVASVGARRPGPLARAPLRRPGQSFEDYQRQQQQHHQ
jgi:hypothetical protein